MNWTRNITCSLAALTFAACGVSESRDITAELKAPGTGDAHITVSSEFNLAVTDSELADRIVIEEIQINVADVRLLGAHPDLPVGGLPLLSESQLHALSPGARSGLELPFPSRYQFDQDLAVYMKIEPGDELEGASLVIRARLYRDAIAKGHALTAITDPDGEPDKEMNAITDPDGEPDKEVGITDPDGEPDKEVGITDPDGEPDKDRTGITDPDGEPDKERGDSDRQYFAANDSDSDTDCDLCQQRQFIQSDSTPYVQFELRDLEAMDLVNSLSNAQLDIVLGISGDKWFTESVVEELNRALDEVIQAEFENRAPRTPTRVIVDHRGQVRDHRAKVLDRTRQIEDGEIRSDLGNFEQIQIRRW